jgi:Tfp pilus assembly protein PilX
VSGAQEHRRGAGRASGRQQSGVATLLVVMGLFFVVSMVAAYTSRNLIFEQRTSANQYRATQAFEAAEAGLEWALALLNGGRLDAQCNAAAAGSTADNFRQRYLPDLINAASTAPTAGPGCQLNSAGGWTCGCPANGVAAVSTATGAATLPAYRVRFRELASPYPRFFTLESRGCTSPDEACLSQAEVRGAGSGAAALVSIKAALVPALATRPQAAVTVAQSVTGSSAVSKAVNTDAASNGTTVLHGAPGPIAGMTGITPAGSASPTSGVTHDQSLLGAPANDQLFTRFFGMSAARFATQTSTVQGCSLTQACTLDDVRAAAAANPGRPIWVREGLTIDAAGPPLGTTDTPVLLIVNGPLQVSDNLEFVGVIYGRGAVTAAGGSSLVRGALIGEQGLTVNAQLDVFYDRDVIDRIRNTQGTIVRVPGSWKDF